MGPETTTSVGGVTGLHLIPCITKCMTEEQVWLLICAVASMRLGVPPSRWPLPCRTIPSKGVILFFILSGTAPAHPLKSLAGSLGTQGSDLTQNQNTLQSSSPVLQWSPSSQFPAFAGDWKGERKEINNQENALLDRRPFPYTKHLIGGCQPPRLGLQCLVLKPTIPKM